MVISYFNKALSNHERNYCVCERELSAIVKNSEGQVARRTEILQGVDFENAHRADKSHGKKDALSR